MTNPTSYTTDPACYTAGCENFDNRDLRMNVCGLRFLRAMPACTGWRRVDLAIDNTRYGAHSGRRGYRTHKSASGVGQRAHHSEHGRTGGPRVDLTRPHYGLLPVR
jgi:hypothetical protein